MSVGPRSFTGVDRADRSGVDPTPPGVSDARPRATSLVMPTNVATTNTGGMIARAKRGTRALLVDPYTSYRLGPVVVRSFSTLLGGIAMAVTASPQTVEG